MRWLPALLLLLAPALGHAQPAKDVELARAAYRFGFPVYQMMAQRGLGAARLPPGFNGSNTIFTRSTLVDHRAREVTTPNNDVLYGHAWLDLSGPPVIFSMPDLPNRFHVVSLLDLFTDNVLVLGSRATGGKGGRYLIAGPGWRGEVPKGVQLVRAPMTDMWLIIRVLVDGPDDLAAGRLVLSGFQLATMGEPPYRPMVAPASNPADPQTFLSVVNEALARGPMPPDQARRAAALFRAGIGQPWTRLTPQMQAAWRLHAPRFYDELKGGLGSTGWTAQGWTYPRPTLGRFGVDDFYRAKVALGGIAALPISDAVYVSTGRDVDGLPLFGTKGYRLHIPANVPVRGFWSLTMYEMEEDGRLFLTANPIARYSIGDRTAGLRRNADGSVDVLLSHAPPPDQSNWLPAPSGLYRLTFRGYWPEKPLQDGRFRLPPVTPLVPRVQNASAPLPGGVQRGDSAGRSSRKGKANFKDKTGVNAIGS